MWPVPRRARRGIEPLPCPDVRGILSPVARAFNSLPSSAGGQLATLHEPVHAPPAGKAEVLCRLVGCEEPRGDHVQQFGHLHRYPAAAALPSTRSAWLIPTSPPRDCSTWNSLPTATAQARCPQHREDPEPHLERPAPHDRSRPGLRLMEHAGLAARRAAARLHVPLSRPCPPALRGTRFADLVDEADDLLEDVRHVSRIGLGPLRGEGPPGVE